MSSVLTSANRYRHVVFTTVAAGQAVDLGAARGGRPPQPVLQVFPDYGSTEREMDDGTFLAWLFRRAGLNLQDYRPGSLIRRLPACLRVLRVSTVAQARRTLHGHPHLFPIALDALLLGVTEFFRDANVFACLEQRLRVIAAQDYRSLRIWSAGCSTGAELYSVSVMLAELGLLARSELLGTDVRSEAIECARRGMFVPAPVRSRGFSHDVSIKPLEGQRITWRCRNVLKDVEPGPWDVILCRNMAMYLQRSAADRLWPKLAAELRPGGLLVVGKAERPCDSIGLVNVGPCVYQRIES